MRFWLSGFSTMTFSAFPGPIRCGKRYVPPQPGSRPRRHSGNATAVTPEEIVRYEQCSASSRPPPRAAPFTNANDGTLSSPSRRNTACPSRAMVRASSRAAISGAPLRSAPTAKMNGLPVTPTAAMSVRAATASSASFSDCSPAGPNVFGRVWSRPLSSVMSAIVPAPSGSSTSRTSALVTTSSGNSEVRSDASGIEVLPQDGAAHAQPDAHRGQAVAGPISTRGLGGELAGQLDHQPHAGTGERVAERDRAAPRVHPRVVVGDLEVLQERQHLHGERLVDLDEADVVHGQGVAGEQLLGRGDGPDAHHLRLDAGEREVDEPHPRREAEVAGDVLGGQQACGRAVVEARGVP